MDNRGYYILVAQDAFDADDRQLHAYTIAKKRLSSRIWPLYTNTRNRKSIMPGDKLCVYVGGRFENKGLVIASCEVERLEHGDSIYKNFEYDIIADSTTRFIVINNVREFAPFALYRKIEKEAFMPKNKQRWGVVLMGGTRRISRQIYENIFDDETEIL